MSHCWANMAGSKNRQETRPNMNSEFVPLNQGGPEIYTFPSFAKFGFSSFVSGRSGGVSGGEYSSLNTSFSAGDDPGNVTKNMAAIANSVGYELLWTGIQVHGDNVMIIDSSPPPPSIEADAIITSAPGMAIAVRTADCLPILIADRNIKIAGVAHAGRRGTELQIAFKTVRLMIERFSSDPEDIIVAFGPCIRSCCYEVDKNTAERFYDCCGGDGGRHLDISQASKEQLESAGVAADNIIDSGICTSCENHRFYSYRKEGKYSGRFLSGITFGLNG